MVVFALIQTLHDSSKDIKIKHKICYNTSPYIPQVVFEWKG
jgi:hypothetical protein